VTIWDAGADIIVIGNALEQQKEGTLLEDLAAAKRAYNNNFKLS
jgi:heptaprenylglyceryl phosphate synthase